MSVECFRWLLGAIDQAADLLSFHGEWRAWRTAVTGNLIGSDLRRYYAGRPFREDFLSFILSHPLGQHPTIAALARAEHLLNGTEHTAAKPAAVTIPPGKPLLLTSIPHGGGEAQILAIEHSFDEIVRSVASRTVPAQTGVFFYTVRRDANGARKLMEISVWLAAVLRASDGTRTVEEVLDCVAAKLDTVATGMRHDVAARLLEGAHEAGFITIHQPPLQHLTASSRSIQPALASTTL